MKIKTIRDFALHHQSIFLRVDFNIPLDAAGNITNDGRIKATLPTIEYCMEKGARLVLASHLGRPDGVVVEQYRMAPVARRLHELLGQNIHYVEDCVGPNVEHMKKNLAAGDILLLENLRFYKEEEENNLRFAEQLALGIDIYLTDAFGALHRKHASTFALPSLIFDRGIGFLVEHEVDALSKIVHEPDQPLVMVVGGAKISDKVEVLRNLAPQCDVVLVGGSVANVFLKGEGMNMQKSLVESSSVVAEQKSLDYPKAAHEIVVQFQSETPTIQIGQPLQKIQLPLDLVCAPSPEQPDAATVIEIGNKEIPENFMALDIGPKTRDLYAAVVRKARTIFWNGPLGVVEVPAFAHGSEDVAHAAAESDGYAVLGGGDTEAVVQQFNLAGRFSHVSTGGGASLDFLAHGALPGLDVLN